MTASKDISRPSSTHRTSLASSVPNRQSVSRAHSASLGAASNLHRIGRRKSSSAFAPANTAAIEAAVEHAVAEGTTFTNRRTSMSKAALAALNEGGSGRPSLGSMQPHHSHHLSVPENVAITDGPALASFPIMDNTKNRRRASDGSRLSKKEKGSGVDLKCEHCGKAYKHGSCLSKHLWEHTPQWQVTSKLLISKHQQVQLLEAASVLVAMNQDGTPANDSDSSSPAASGSSDPLEYEASSTETTPPPQREHTYREHKRTSTTSSIFSRSYQSVFSAGSAPHEHSGSSHMRQWSTSSNRPTTSGTSIAETYPDEDPADLAAAVGLLSCSYGTPKTGPTHLADVPPVPPLPAKYMDHNTFGRITAHGEPSTDVEMDDSDEDRRYHSRQDEGEYGVFGKMDA